MAKNNANFDDLMTAINGIGQSVKTLSQKVESLENERLDWKTNEKAKAKNARVAKDVKVVDYYKIVSVSENGFERNRENFASKVEVDETFKLWKKLDRFPHMRAYHIYNDSGTKVTANDFALHSEYQR